MQDDTTVKIPLRARDGSVRAYAVVDAADANWMNQWRWGLRAGYAMRKTSRKAGLRRVIYIHREILGLTNWAGLEGDHLDRDRLNCSQSNLRVVTHAENMQNQSSRHGSSSKYRGVYWDKAQSKWRAQITVNGRKIRLGRFIDELEAARVASAARLQLMPYSSETP